MKTYFEFSGTAKRQEYWGAIVAVIVTYITGVIALEEGGTLGALFSLFICVAALWVMVATTVRRLNDAGLNRWWVLATVVPYVGSIATIAFGCIASKEEDDTVDSVDEE
jgi:uncharacterized membrane protein YhaH (DUF805 family)